jgi:hypothetical protein
MESKVNKELDDLYEDFKVLAPDYKKGVIKTAELLLKLQRHNKALIGEGADRGRAYYTGNGTVTG